MLVSIMGKKKVFIGLFGGTFNPVHIGHVQLVRSAQHIASLDVIYCIPTAFAPHKNNKTILPFEERCYLLQSKLQYESSIFLSTIEAELPTPSYTFRTLQYFSRSFPYSEQFFICGSFDFLGIHSWEHGKYILRYTNYVIAPRNSIGIDDIKKYIEKYVVIKKIEEEEQKITLYSQDAKYIYLCIPMIPISSTEIRSINNTGEEDERTKSR